MSEDATPFRYKAFVSYSWADAAWGKWVHRAIETYRTPAALVGKEGRHGPVPARLHPVFKDREEEAAGGSIGAAVEAALAASEFLVVVCSPRSAQSQWVGREIAWFKAHRDPDKVLALLVDGEPDEAFPAALTHRTRDDLTITDERLDDPLAADARPTGDGKRGARLKLAAAMLGVGLGELVDRDNRRRVMRQRIVVGASLALALVMSALAIAAVRARNEADRQRAEADGLVEFMLTDLRDKLEPVGRLDALDVVGKRALKYYAQQDPGSLDADSLGRRSRALHLVGEVTNVRGDSAGGLVAFRQAAKTTAELLARAPDDQQRIFDHAQSVFWVGYIAYERGENAEAERNFRQYKALADRLIALNPRKKEWQLESSYAETNLGVMYEKLGRTAEAERAFSLGLDRLKQVIASEPFDASRQIELGSTVNWLAQVKGQLGKPSEASRLFDREVAIYEEIARRDPSNTMARNRLSIALQFVGSQQLDEGRLTDAIGTYERAIATNAALRALEPGNTEWQETAVSALRDQAVNFAYAGRNREARAMLDKSNVLLFAMIATDPTNAGWSKALKGENLLSALILSDWAGKVVRQDEFESARSWLNANPDRKGSVLASSILASLGNLDAAAGRTESAKRAWQAILAQTPRRASTDSLRFHASDRLGLPEARDISERLDRRGYRHPAYLRERRLNP